MALFGDKTIGIDISDHSAEMAGVTGAGDKIKVVAKKRVIIPPGVVERGEIKNEAELTKILKQLVSTSKNSKITFGLPESQTFFFIHNLEPDQKALTSSEIHDITTLNIPVDEKELVYAYTLLKPSNKPVPDKKAKDKNKQDKNKPESKDQKQEDNSTQASEKKPNQPNRYLIVATNNDVFEQWNSFFKKNNITASFDIETLAARRGLFSKNPDKPVAVIDIGAQTSNIGIYDDLGMAYTFTSNIAGNEISKHLADKLNTPIDQAEKSKLSLGLTDVNNSTSKLIAEKIDQLAEQITTHLSQFKENNQQSADQLIIIGGSSKMPGIAEYLSSKLNKTVSVGKSPWLSNAADLEYIEAVGLAIRGLNRPQDNTDPILRTRAGLSGKSALGMSVGKAFTGKGKTNTSSSTRPTSSIASQDEIEEVNKFQKEKKLFFAVSSLGLLVILLLGWYRYDQNAKREAGLQAEEQIKEAAEANKPKPAVKKKQPASDGTEPVVKEATSSAQPKSLGSLVINQTSVGFLRVRGGAGTSFEEVGRVSPDEEFEILEQQDDWYKIQLEDENQTQGWVLDAFVTIIEDSAKSQDADQSTSETDSTDE